MGNDLNVRNDSGNEPRFRFSVFVIIAALIYVTTFVLQIVAITSCKWSVTRPANTTGEEKLQIFLGLTHTKTCINDDCVKAKIDNPPVYLEASLATLIIAILFNAAAFGALVAYVFKVGSPKTLVIIAVVSQLLSGTFSLTAHVVFSTQYNKDLAEGFSSGLEIGWGLTLAAQCVSLGTCGVFGTLSSEKCTRNLT